jgi:serine kinase of HPr protein (carbohydrate metabolism regulator)
MGTDRGAWGGILLLGGSGVEKAKRRLNLLKRDTAWFADDAVEIKRISDTTLVGSAPESIATIWNLGESASWTLRIYSGS